jgi:Domain of unknown function (DUF4288)
MILGATCEDGMWYSARLLYECAVDDQVEGDVTFEEKVVVFCSDDEETEEIVRKVEGIANQKQVEYDNSESNKVRWIFRELLELQQIMSESIQDGTEVYFRHWDNPDSKALEVIRGTHEGRHPW